MKNKCMKKICIILVNLITLTRFVGAFVLPFIYQNYGISITSLIVLCLFITDAIDGFLARRLKISTMFGSAMDALSDKILFAFAFLLLGITYNILFVPLVLELIILLINYLIYRHGGNVQTSKKGRFKTIILDILVAICYIILSLPTLHINIQFVINNTDLLVTIFTFIMAIFDIIAIIDYYKKYLSVRNDKKLTHIKYQDRTRKTFKEVLNDLFDTDYYIKHKNEPILKQFYK